MDALAREELEVLGVNFDSGLKRFMGNETLFLDFLKRFPKDTSFQEMMDAMEKEDYEAALKAAHALKGVTGNLSLDCLHDNLTILVEFFRENKLEQVPEYVEKIKTSYVKLMEGMKKWLDC